MVKYQYLTPPLLVDARIKDAYETQICLIDAFLTGAPIKERVFISTIFFCFLLITNSFVCVLFLERSLFKVRRGRTDRTNVIKVDNGIQGNGYHRGTIMRNDIHRSTWDGIVET